MSWGTEKQNYKMFANAKKDIELYNADKQGAANPGFMTGFGGASRNNSVKELRELAKKRRVPLYSSMNKADLLRALK